MKLAQISILMVVLFLTSSAFGQKYLQKPYTQWSKEDAAKIMSDSPWATQYQSEEGLVAAQQQQQARDANDNNRGTYRGNQGRVDTPPPIYVRLHSALPVRQARVRLQQIAANYDKLSADDQKKFDETTAKYLECPVCKEYYVVTMAKWKDTSTTVTDGIFQTMKLEDLKGKIWLANDRDEKIELAEFTPPKNAADNAVLFFKRPDGGTFFGPTDKLMRIVFSNELRGSGVNAYSTLIPKAFEFKISRMVNEGHLIF